MYPDHLKPRIQHNEGQSAEEIRADADIIRAETERLREVLRKLESSPRTSSNYRREVTAPVTVQQL